MKWFKVLFLSFFFLIAGCSGGDDTVDLIDATDSDGTTSIVSNDDTTNQNLPSHFVGTYSERDSTCDEFVPKRFEITQQSTGGFSVTILNSGNSRFVSTGDTFTDGNVVTNFADGIRYDILGFQSLLCESLIISSEIFEVINFPTIDLNIGDLLLACTDNSSEGFCLLSYEKE